MRRLLLALLGHRSLLALDDSKVKAKAVGAWLLARPKPTPPPRRIVPIAMWAWLAAMFLVNALAPDHVSRRAANDLQAVLAAITTVGVVGVACLFAWAAITGRRRDRRRRGERPR